MTSTARPGPGGVPHLGPPTALRRNLVIGAIGATIVLGWIGDAFWASLVDRNPLALILLNAKPRYLLLTVNDLDPWVYYTVATVRLLCTKPLVWLVGAWYGPRTVSWAEERTPRAGAAIRWAEHHFGRFGWVIIAITSNNVVCLLAGSAGFSLVWFMVLAIAGTLVRLWLIDHVGGLLGDPIDEFVALVVDHRGWVVAASIAVVVLGLWWQHRRGRSQLDDLADLDHSMAGGPGAGAPDDRAGQAGTGAIDPDEDSVEGGPPTGPTARRAPP